MDQNDVTQIKIQGQSVGILGLKAILKEMAEELGEESDQTIKDKLIHRLSKLNYIPDKARENYSKAFLREFKKFIGKPFDEDGSSGIHIKVLGPGCNQCNRLEQDIISVLVELNLPAEVEHVRDIEEIGKYGVMGTPALVINGEVKAVGKIPSRDRIRKWLEPIVN